MAKKPKPARKTNLVESLDRIRAAGGHAWDNVKDPVRFIRDMRGGVVKVPKRKPKPATAGEKIVMLDTALPISVVRETPEIRMVAKQIDRAIARAVKKERDRCIRCLQVDGLFIPLTLLDGSKP